MMAGAYSLQDTAPEQKLIDFALAEINKKTEGAALKLVKVNSYKTQVVAGVNHAIELELAGETGSKVHNVVIFESLPPAMELKFSHEAHIIN